MSEPKRTADVVVVGAGVIGLAIALQMQQRGARVVVIERGNAMQQASHAAAGMLAVDDPGNPPELLTLSRLSVDLYPTFLRHIEVLSGLPVPFQTDTTIQYNNAGTTRLAEHSVDPRQLADAILAAVRALSITLLQQTTLLEVDPVGRQLRLQTADGTEILTDSVVYSTGAWMLPPLSIPISPRKGQMLRVRIPSDLELKQVHRSEQVYVVPRTTGPQAGTALIGATVEDAGFDTTVHPEDLARLRSLASGLIPELATATTIEAWAGLRPATPDGLPLLGATNTPRSFIATGHYRNGILLAPATAHLIGNLLTGETPNLDLRPFAPQRFTQEETSPSPSDIRAAASDNRFRRLR